MGFMIQGLVLDGIEATFRRTYSKIRGWRRFSAQKIGRERRFILRTVGRILSCDDFVTQSGVFFSSTSLILGEIPKDEYILTGFALNVLSPLESKTPNLPTKPMKTKTAKPKKLSARRKALLEDYFSNALVIAAILDSCRPTGIFRKPSSN